MVHGHKLIELYWLAYGPATKISYEPTPYNAIIIP
jgi:hypothetical protein